jgi:hypothetical protein
LKRQDTVEYLSGLFKSDFSGYRDIVHGLPDLHGIVMAAVNRKIRPSDFAKLITRNQSYKTALRVSQLTLYHKIDQGCQIFLCA